MIISIFDVHVILFFQVGIFLFSFFFIFLPVTVRPQAVQRVNLAGFDLTCYLQRLMMERGYCVHDTGKNRLLLDDAILLLSSSSVIHSGSSS